MILKCVAIDDEPLALELLKTYANRIPGLQLIETFEDAISGMEYLNKFPVDLLFLDVNMPDISGIDVAKGLAYKPLLIFTTAYRQFAYDGFQLNAIDYLLKPIDFETFLNAFNKAIAYKEYQAHSVESNDDDFIYVYSEYRLLKILLQDIEYIESMEDYVKIHYGHVKPIVTLMTLKKITLKLPMDQFIRIHRSYVINTRKIKAIHNKKIQLDTVLLPIGDSYAGNLIKPNGINS
jgi:two-component system LytT family response regulator